MAVTQQRLRAFTSMTYTKPFMTPDGVLNQLEYRLTGPRPEA